MTATKLKVFRASDRSPLAEIEADDAVALERKLALASEAFADLRRRLPVQERVAILGRVAALVDAKRDVLAKQIAEEGGKPLTDAIVEVVRAADGLRNAADELRTFAGREIPMGLTAPSQGRWAFTTKEPIGVVAAISAFNHPLNLVVHQTAPAVAVGCPVIVKPAATTPLSCLSLVAMYREAGLPEALCQTLVTEDNALAERLAVDPRIAFLTFIGSARVGWSLRSKLAPGARCALEHGGAAPVIVDRSADLDRIIEPIVKGGYYHAGQVCVSVQRIFVHHEMRDAFVERLARRALSLRVGDAALPDTEVGPLILPREVERVAAWIDEAVAGGAEKHGGKRVSETTLEPCVLVEPPRDAKVSQLEIFGPVTCVYGYSEIDEAIDRANALPFAFQASVFSRDIGPALRAAKRLDAATVLVNDHTAFRTDWMPFSGRRQSGLGVGGIPYTMHDMTQEKMIVLRHDA
ncbi:MAG: aldehyde dehydrogenase family protein [Deltaproteobacteria bacterium]|nr:aldehyde dehydrogenase family protein [Deltaproteobacteria bacterium]